MRELHYPMIQFLITTLSRVVTLDQDSIAGVLIRKLGHVTFNGHFAREELKLEMAPFYNSSQSKKLQPNMSLDERIDICARDLLNNLLQV